MNKGDFEERSADEMDHCELRGQVNVVSTEIDHDELRARGWNPSRLSHLKKYRSHQVLSAISLSSFATDSLCTR